MNYKTKAIYNVFIEANYGSIKEAKLIFNLPDVVSYVEGKYANSFNSDIAHTIYKHKDEYLEMAGAEQIEKDNDQDILYIKNKLPFIAEFDPELFEAINRFIETRESKTETKVIYKDFHLFPLYLFVIAGIIIGILF